MKTKTNSTQRAAGLPSVEEILHQIKQLNRENKRRVLYKLLRMLLGPNPTDEVGIYDTKREIYGYFLPTPVRLRLRKAENPKLYRELERRSRSTAPAIPMEQVLNKLLHATRP